MKTAITLFVVAGVAAAASAQTGKLTWEVSKDGGTTWASGLTSVEPTQASVLVRAVASWAGIPAGLGFAGAFFDGVVTGLQAGDGASSFARNFTFAAQTIVAQPNGAGAIKIDDARDTFAPGFSGTGQRSVNPSQGVPQFTNPFITSNPVVVFSYTLSLGGELGVRNISSVFNASGTANTRALTVYTTAGGASVSVAAANIGLNAAQVEVVPAPGAIALLGLGGLIAGRRRR
jgi:hypothetical protein